MDLPLDAVQPNPGQPRRRFSEAALDALAVSVREHGILQPVLVRRVEAGRYEIIAGERRWQAARRAGLDTIPAVIIAASSQRAQELALVENVQRADLTPLEEAEAYRNLMNSLGLTQEELAGRIGISRVAVANRLRLLSLAPEAMQALDEQRITEGHARAILALPLHRQGQAVAAIEAAQLSVRQTERLARRWLAGSRRSGRRDSDAGVPDARVDALAGILRDVLGARVLVRESRAGVTVVMHFHSVEAAQQLAEPWVTDGSYDL